MHPTGDRASWLKGPQCDCEGTGLPPARPWRLVLLGAPGIGKGTQAALLSEKLGACPLSTGDVFRAARACATSLSPAMEAALGHMRRGELVPDDTVVAMVRERTRCLACHHGFLLDGFPRTVEQAEALDVILTEIDRPLDAVLSFDLDVGKVVARLSGRRTCPGCRRTYHVVATPPTVDGVCDACGTALIQREDDRPEAIAVRMKAYHESTAPLEAFYSQRGLLLSIDADGAPDDVFARALTALRGLTEATRPV